MLEPAERPADLLPQRSRQGHARRVRRDRRGHLHRERRRLRHRHVHADARATSSATATRRPSRSRSTRAYNRAPSCNDNTFSPKRVVDGEAHTLDLGAVCTRPRRRPAGVHAPEHARPRQRHQRPGGDARATPRPAATPAPTRSVRRPRRPRRRLARSATEHLQVVASLAPTCTANSPITLRPGQAKARRLQLQRPGLPAGHLQDRRGAERHAEPAGRLDSNVLAPTPRRPPPGPTASPTRRVSSGGESAVTPSRSRSTPSTNGGPICGSNSGMPARHRPGPRPDDADRRAGASTPTTTRSTFTPRRPRPAARHRDRVQRRHHLHLGRRPTPGPTRSATSPTTVTAGRHQHVLGQRRRAGGADLRRAVRDQRPARRTPSSVSFDCFDPFGDPLTFQITDAPDLGHALARRATGRSSSAPTRRALPRATTPSPTAPRTPTARATSPPRSSTSTPPPTRRPTASATRASPRRSRPARRKTLAPFCDDERQRHARATRSCPSPPTARSATAAARSSTRPPRATPAPTSSTTRPPTATAASPRRPRTTWTSPPRARRPARRARRSCCGRTRAAPFTFDCDDPSGGALSYVIDSPPARGTLTGCGAGRSLHRRRPRGRRDVHAGTSTATTAGDSATQTQVITVDASQNAAPICPPSITIAAEAGEQQTVSPSCTDGDDDPLTFAEAERAAARHAHRQRRRAALHGRRRLRGAATRSPTARPTATAAQSGISTVTARRHAHQPRAGLHGALRLRRSRRTRSSASRRRRCTDGDGETRDLRDHDPARRTARSATPAADGSRTYTPDPGYDGRLTRSRSAPSTASTYSATQTVQITVTPRTNQAPDLLRRLALRAPRPRRRRSSSPARDPDGDPVTLELVGRRRPTATLGAIDQGTDRVVYTPGRRLLRRRLVHLPRHRRPRDRRRRRRSRSPSRARRPATTSRGGRPSARGVGAAQLHRPDGDDLTLSIADGPAHGSLGAIAGGAVTYTPDGGYSGADSFTYRASDGTAELRARHGRDHDHADAELRRRVARGPRSAPRSRCR